MAEIRRTKTGKKGKTKIYTRVMLTGSSGRAYGKGKLAARIASVERETAVPTTGTTGRRTASELAELRRILRELLDVNAEQRKNFAKLSQENTELRKVNNSLRRALADAAQARQTALSPESTLTALCARRRYAPLLERRAIAALSDKEMTQAQIADLAGVSQAHVSRTLALIADHPEVLDPDPQEIGWQYALGELSEQEMLAILSTWSYTFGQPQGDAWERGTWDDVMVLVADHFISKDQYGAVSEAVEASRAR